MYFLKYRIPLQLHMPNTGAIRQISSKGFTYYLILLFSFKVILLYSHKIFIAGITLFGKCDGVRAR